MYSGQLVGSTGGGGQHAARGSPTGKVPGTSAAEPPELLGITLQHQVLGVQPVPAHILGFPCDSHHTHVFPPTRFSSKLAGLGL